MDSYYNEKIMPHRQYSIITKIIFILLLLSIVYFVFNNRGPVTNTEYGENSVRQDPIQKKISSNDTIIKNIDNEYACIIYPQALYQITAKVKGINTINFTDPEWRKKLSKYDIGVVWGKLADEYYDKFITYSQINRFLNWNYSYEIGLSGSYILSHVSNNHIIPANENILKGISKLKENDICYMEGKLVNYDITQNNIYIAHMDTSLSRTDSGNGACETFYVEKIILGDEIYE